MADTLKFVARADLLVRVPGSIQMPGSPTKYVNRGLAKVDSGWGYPALAEPYAVPGDSDETARLVSMVTKDAALWPFDKVTAEACGVEFIPVAFKDGVWIEKIAASKKELITNG